MTQLYDPIRKKHVADTPEERVRIQFISFLVHQRDFPKGLIAVERGVEVNLQKQRTDIVVYNKQQHPLVLVECKAPTVSIDQSTLDQAIAYNSKIKAPYLLLTNGKQVFGFKQDFESKSCEQLSDIPNFSDL